MRFCHERRTPFFVVIVVHHKVSGLHNRRTADPESPNFTWTQTTSSIAKPDMAALATYRRLQNVTEYCINVFKTGPTGIGSNNSVMVVRKIIIIICSDLVIASRAVVVIVSESDGWAEMILEPSE